MPVLSLDINRHCEKLACHYVKPEQRISSTSYIAKGSIIHWTNGLFDWTCCFNQKKIPCCRNIIYLRAQKPNRSVQGTCILENYPSSVQKNLV